MVFFGRFHLFINDSLCFLVSRVGLDATDDGEVSRGNHFASRGNTEHSNPTDRVCIPDWSISPTDSSLADSARRSLFLLRSSERVLRVHWAIHGPKATESKSLLRELAVSNRPLFPNEIGGNDCVVRLFMVIGRPTYQVWPENLAGG